MWDYDLRFRKMDEAGVDLAIVSLTCPNACWGGRGGAEGRADGQQFDG